MLTQIRQNPETIQNTFRFPKRLFTTYILVAYRFEVQGSPQYEWENNTFTDMASNAKMAAVGRF